MNNPKDSADSLPCGVRLLNGDLSLSLSELRMAEAEIITALEFDIPLPHKRMLTELLAVARDLISRQTN